LRFEGADFLLPLPLFLFLSTTLQLKFTSNQILLKNKTFSLRLNLKAEKMVGGYIICYINGVYKQTLYQTKKGGDKKWVTAK